MILFEEEIKVTYESEANNSSGILFSSKGRHVAIESSEDSDPVVCVSRDISSGTEDEDDVDVDVDVDVVVGGCIRDSLLFNVDLDRVRVRFDRVVMVVAVGSMEEARTSTFPMIVECIIGRDYYRCRCFMLCQFVIDVQYGIVVPKFKFLDGLNAGLM